MLEAYSSAPPALLPLTVPTFVAWQAEIASLEQWIFNISTKTLKAGTTYVCQTTLNEGSTIDSASA